jgi:hypothetical protein
MHHRILGFLRHGDRYLPRLRVTSDMLINAAYNLMSNPGFHQALAAD